MLQEKKKSYTGDTNREIIYGGYKQRNHTFQNHHYKITAKPKLEMHNNGSLKWLKSKII
jgi:hypothetical protein